MTSARKRFSVIIPTYNVADIIGRCLDSLTFADEVVVVDMFSADATEEVCRRYPNVRFLQRQDYIFGNVNYGIDQASGDWIMRHDSDEAVTPELRDEILEVLSSDGDGYDGFYIAEQTFVFGRWIPLNGEPGKGGREKLFRRGCLRYPVHSEHEQPEITGRWGHLKNVYLHYSHPSISGWLAKMNYYTDRDVERVQEIDPRLFRPHRFITYPAHIFRYHYFTCGLRRYGRHGFILSLLMAVYAFVERAKLWERHQRNVARSQGEL